MAEALTLIGGVAAIMQLSGTMVKLTRDLRDCVETVRSAPKEIEYFILETSVFTDLLCYFHKVAKEIIDKLDRGLEATRVDLIQKIARQCESVKDEFAHLVERFASINRRGDLTPLNTFWARVLWLWKKPDVPELRLSIQIATTNVSLLSNCFQLEERNRSRGKDEEIQMLKDKLISYALTVRKLKSKLARRQRRKHPSKRLPEINNLEGYVISAIHSHTQEEPSRQRQRKPLFAKVQGDWIEVALTDDGLRPVHRSPDQEENERIMRGLSRAQVFVQTT